MENIAVQGKFYTADDDSYIVEKAKEFNINLPDADLGAFRTVYAKIQEANGNNVRLHEDAVKKSLKTLIGKQINFEHYQQGNICGYTIDATLNGDYIEIVGIFFKSVYPEKWEEAQELQQDGELSVSFELIAPMEAREYLEDGTVLLKDVRFTGTGLLLEHEPACKDAKVFEITARKENYEQVCAKVGDLINNQENGGSESMTEKEKQEFIAKLTEELGELCANWTEEDFLNQEKVDEARKQLNSESQEAEKTEESEAKEDGSSEEAEEETEEAENESEEESETEGAEKTEETEKEDTEASEETEEKEEDEEATDDETDEEDSEEKEDKEESDEETAGEMITEEHTVTYEKWDEKGDMVLKEGVIIQQYVDSEGNVDVMERRFSDMVVYTYAHLEAVKADYEAKIEQAKKETAELVKIKEEMKNNEFAKDFTDEDYLDSEKVEKAKILQENKDLKAKLESVPEVKVEADLSTGHRGIKRGSSSVLAKVLRKKK